MPFCGFKFNIVIFPAARRFRLRTRNERKSERETERRRGNVEANERTEDAGCRERPTVRRSNSRDRSGGECPLNVETLRCFSSRLRGETMPSRSSNPSSTIPDNSSLLFAGKVSQREPPIRLVRNESAKRNALGASLNARATRRCSYEVSLFSRKSIDPRER